MTIAANQPYLFPYLGYFQLIAGADLFVSYDCMQYEKRSWINRNRLLVQGSESLITSPVIKAPQCFAINKREYQPGFLNDWRAALDFNYKRAPFYGAVRAMIEEMEGWQLTNVADFNTESLKLVSRYIGIATPFKKLSEMEKPAGEQMQLRTINLVKSAGAERYVNLPGGRSLYDKNLFAREGIELQFLEPWLPPYRQQRTREFHPGLSILDLLCNVSPSEILDMVKSARFS